jgi:hypothetical protein
LYEGSRGGPGIRCECSYKYWTLISDAIIHRIHDRVLDHIKRETEALITPG